MTSSRWCIGIHEERYPAQLRESPDPPARLYGLGDPDALQPGLAVVGARRATPYGLHAACDFAGWSAAAGFCVISGAAIGCDQAAHRAALERDGVTVAVLAGGADVCYPKGAAALLDLIARRGAVVSEHPWGTPPQRWMFRTRNRIIAGLCSALLVVEARIPSGTFSTADYALSAQRDVLAVPGSIYAPECEGPNRLISQGAVPITHVDDLAVALGALCSPRTSVGPEPRGVHDPVVIALRANAMRVDELASSLGVGTLEMSRRVGVLEAAGLIERYPDGRYGAFVR